MTDPPVPGLRPGLPKRPTNAMIPSPYFIPFLSCGRPSDAGFAIRPAGHSLILACRIGFARPGILELGQLSEAGHAVVTGCEFDIPPRPSKFAAGKGAKACVWRRWKQQETLTQETYRLAKAREAVDQKRICA